MNKLLLPMNLQMFAEPAGEPNPGDSSQSGQQPAGGQATPPAFDYDKLASVISGKQNVAEDTVLKSYFKQQGLSKEEMDQAINTFKEQKAANTPDVNALQAQAEQAQQLAVKAQLDAKAQMAAIQLGVDVKVLPYVLKMADLSSLTIESKDEDFTAALNKVLEDVPALKTNAVASTGFQAVGSAGQSQAQSATENQLDRIFGIKNK
ncbi:hypothetical protein [Enterococcus sp. AZ103]|uniref:hypothetical protein n=1 Tax=Enterococcus sp. AZ103 TaxID=2774628 RepID=UPI003F24F95D